MIALTGHWSDALAPAVDAGELARYAASKDKGAWPDDRAEAIYRHASYIRDAGQLWRDHHRASWMLWMAGVLASRSLALHGEVLGALAVIADDVKHHVKAPTAAQTAAVTRAVNDCLKELFAYLDGNATLAEVRHAVDLLPAQPVGTKGAHALESLKLAAGAIEQGVDLPVVAMRCAVEASLCVETCFGEEQAERDSADRLFAMVRTVHEQIAWETMESALRRHGVEAAPVSGDSVAVEVPRVAA